MHHNELCEGLGRGDMKKYLFKSCVNKRRQETEVYCFYAECQMLQSSLKPAFCSHCGPIGMVCPTCKKQHFLFVTFPFADKCKKYLFLKSKKKKFVGESRTVCVSLMSLIRPPALCLFPNL